MTILEKIGFFSAEVVKALALGIPAGTEILLSERTLQHIKTRHPDVGTDLQPLIASILTAPDGIARRSDGSVAFYRKHEDGKEFYLDVAVRPSSKNEYFVRTMHFIKAKRFDWYIRRGVIKMLDKPEKP
jgi:hypothetical protein